MHSLTPALVAQGLGHRAGRSHTVKAGQVRLVGGTKGSVVGVPREGVLRAACARALAKCPDQKAHWTRKGAQSGTRAQA